MKLSRFLIFFLIVGCGPTCIVENPTICKQDDPRKHNGIDTEFEDYVALFEEITGTKVWDLPINFSHIEEEASIGICRTYFNKVLDKTYKEIFIRREYWEEASDNSRESLMLHELGHCVLNRHHTEERIERDGYKIPISVMNPFNIGGYFYYEPNREYYFEELKEAK